MVLQVGLQPVLGDFGCALGGQATKSTVLVRPKDLFMLILSWEANFLGPVVLQVGRQPPLGDFGCVLGGQATKSTDRVRPKDIFCINFGQEWHLPSQHPGFGSKLSLKKVNQGPVHF
jgi:hypothetical protein